MKKRILLLLCCVLLFSLCFPLIVHASDGEGDAEIPPPEIVTVEFQISGLKHINNAKVRIVHRLTGTPYELTFSRNENVLVSTVPLYIGEYYIESADSLTKDYSLHQLKGTFQIQATDETYKWSATEKEEYSASKLLKNNLLWIILLPVGIIILLIVRKAGVSNNKLFTS